LHWALFCYFSTSIPFAIAQRIPSPISSHKATPPPFSFPQTPNDSSSPHVLPYLSSKPWEEQLLAPISCPLTKNEDAALFELEVAVDAAAEMTVRISDPDLARRAGGVDRGNRPFFDNDLGMKLIIPPMDGCIYA
ncbi:hypothetical protein Ancab_007550, partial [Ancistrocladus abbreviatus]